MPKPCPICTGPQRDEVDDAIDARVSFRDLASRFGGTKDRYLRHRRHPRPPGPSDEAVALSSRLIVPLNRFLAEYPRTDLALVREALRVLEKAASKAFGLSHAPART